ncbi:uncharacterized protein KZ484_020685 [Pholidichthys leucotaenia]
MHDEARSQKETKAGPGRLAVVNGTMNSAVYQKILKENVWPSVCDLKLKHTWVLQQGNDPKHTSKSTSEWLKKSKMKTLEWPSQSPDLNPIEMLFHDLKKPKPPPKPAERKIKNSEKSEKPTPVLPPRPVGTEPNQTQYRVKQMAKQIETIANMKQRETKEKPSEAPVLPPRPKEKELNSATRYSECRREQAEDAESIREADQPQTAIVPKDEAEFKQTSREAAEEADSEEEQFEEQNKDEKSAKPKQEKGGLLSGMFRKRPKNKSSSPAQTVSKTDSDTEDSEDDEKSSVQTQEKGGFFSGILKKSNKPANDTSSQTNRKRSPNLTTEEAGSEKEQSEKKNKDKKNVEPKEEKGGLLSGMFKKTSKDRSSSPALMVRKTDSDAEDSEDEEKTTKQTHEKGGFFSGILKKSSKPADDMSSQDNLSVHSELSVSSDSLSEQKEKRQLFGGMFKKSPKPSEASQTNQDEKTQTEVPGDDESLSENNSTKGSEPSPGEVSVSCDSLSENKEKGGLFSGLIKKSKKKAEEENLLKHKDVSSSIDSLSDAASTKEKTSNDSEAPGSSEGPTENNKEKSSGLLGGILKKSPKAPREKTSSPYREAQELLASIQDPSDNNSTKEKSIFSKMFKKSPEPAEAFTEEMESELNTDDQSSGTCENLSDTAAPKEKGLFSGRNKKTPKTAGDEEAAEDKDSQKELFASNDSLAENSNAKEKKGGLAGFFKRSASIENLFDEEKGLFSGLHKKTPKAARDEDAAEDKDSQAALFSSNESLVENNNTKEKNILSGLFKKAQKPADEEPNLDKEKKLSSSCDNLLEATASKEKSGGFTGLFKKSPKPAPRTITTQDPITKQLSGSWDSLTEVGKDDAPTSSELSASNDNLSEATNTTKEKKVGFGGLFMRTPKSEQKEKENMEPSEGGGLRRKRTIKKKKRVVSFRVKKTVPKFPKLNLASQSSDKMPAIEETVELQDINPEQETTVVVQPVEMAAYPTTENLPESEREANELLEWWNSVKDWTQWNEASNFQEGDEEMAMEQAADRVYKAARVFVYLFNQRGAKLQTKILELLAMADAADEFHRKTVSAAVGGGVASVAGSLATITGLILAPFTFGASIIVTAVGIGVATAGSITSATANITDTVHSNMDRKKVEKLIQGYQEEIEDIRKCMEFVQEGINTLQEWDFEKYTQSAAKKALNHNIKHVMKEGGRAGKALMINTDKLISTVQVLGAAGGVAKAAQAISVTTGVMSALFLALDVFFLAKDSHELRKGAKTKFASKIREVCKELQDGLLELNKVKTQLQKTMDGIEVEEFEEYEEVEVEVEDDLESDPKKLAELEQELDLLEEKMDKKVKDEKKSKEMEKEKSKIKVKKEEKSMKEKEKSTKDKEGESFKEKEGKGLEDKEKTEENNSEKEENKKEVEGESKLNTTPDEIKELKKETSIKTSKEEVLKEQPLKGSKKEKETENQITAGKEKHESKRDKMKGVTNKTAEREKSKMGGEQDEVKSRSGEDRSQRVKPERESEKRRRSSREDDGGMKPEIKPVNKEKAGESGKTRRHSSRSDKDEERGGKHVTRETEEERGSHHKRRECDDGGVKDWRAEMVKSREEKREDRGSERRRESHQSHQYPYHDSTRSREHSERELGSNREGSKRSHYRSELEERGDEKPVSRLESARREFERAGVQWEVEEGSNQKREDGGSQRRSSNRGREHEHSRRGSRTHSSALLKDGLDI